MATKKAPYPQEVAVSESLKAFGVTYAVHHIGLTEKREGREKPWQCDQWHVTLKREGRPLYTADYFTGLGNREGYNVNARSVYDVERNERARPVAPEAGAVLYSLLSDADCGRDTFSDFCGDMGYDEDSRRAFEVYTACQRTAADLARLFTPTELDTLRANLEDY